jgi:hypothetical protein
MFSRTAGIAPAESSTTHANRHAPAATGDVTDDRRVLTRRTPSRQQFQRDYPGSVLPSASGSAIKRITAGVKASR